MDVAAIIITIVIAAVVLLICRELNCWYLKINARKELLEQLVENQKEIIRLLKGEKEGEEVTASVEEVDLKPEVGKKVKTLVGKGDLPIGTIIRIDRIEGDNLFCSYEMKEVGPYTAEEVTVI